MNGIFMIRLVRASWIHVCISGWAWNFNLDISIGRLLSIPGLDCRPAKNDKQDDQQYS